MARWAMSPGCQTSTKWDGAVRTLSSVCVWGTFHNMAPFSSISKAQGCECLRGRRNCDEPEACKSVGLGFGGFFCYSTKVEILLALGKKA